MKLDIGQIQLYNQLPPAQQKFALAVLDGNRPETAYKKATTQYNPLKAHEWAQNPQITRFVQSVQATDLEARIMTRDEALRTLTSIARGNITDVMNFRSLPCPSGEGTYTAFEVKDLSQATLDQSGIVESIEKGREGTKLRTYSKTEAIKQLRAMCGWDAMDDAMLDILKGNLPLIEIEYVSTSVTVTSD